jgi:hypothetical protein
MLSPKPEFMQILQILHVHQVDYVLIGGLCAALHGSSMNTSDLDLVPNRDESNLQRLAEALSEMGAYYREHPPFKILPDAGRLDSPGHHLLTSRLGNIDVLGSVAHGWDYHELIKGAIWIEIDDVRLCMLDVPMLIKLKRSTGRRKDLAALPILEELLKLRDGDTDESK